MYRNGDCLSSDDHFKDHMEHGVPVQIYRKSQHDDIGFVEGFTSRFVIINKTLYNRSCYTFVSRPGY